MGSLSEHSITEVKGIGEKTAALFAKLGVYTAEDLISHYPRTYDIYEPPVSIADIKSQGIYTVDARIMHAPRMNYGSRTKAVSCVIADGTGGIKAVWFNQPYLAGSLRAGASYIFRGRVKEYRGSLVMEQPAMYGGDKYASLSGAMQPVYDLTAGLKNSTVKKAVASALESFGTGDEYLPASIRTANGLEGHDAAVRNIHFPKDQQQYLAARKRLAFDEFYLFSLSLGYTRAKNERIKNAFPIKMGKNTERLLSDLPYELTGAQQRVIKEIFSDTGGSYVMSRLIQGDVGSGKTIVAVSALIAAAENGYQAAFMAPTEVLASQHYRSVTGILDRYNMDISTGLLTGSMSAKDKREMAGAIKDHEVDIVIGTHALIQGNVEFHNLALVVTDEQHRFGVRQRQDLVDKGNAPHVLVMSATPIPRTMAKILYGDLDISVIDELPADRLPVKNCVVDASYRKTAYKFIYNEVKTGRQAFVICPMAEESELMEGENVVDHAAMLSKIMPDVRIEYLHGQLPQEQKEAIMGRFASGRTQILVSTTVIEVGIDVPNATVMMVEDAQRFGLAQLHQLRGRVGRGRHQSYCIFVDTKNDESSRRRLDVLNSSNDGFYIASKDLEQRGPGDILGIRQSGAMSFVVGDIYKDSGLLQTAAECAARTLENDPELSCEENRLLRQKLSAIKERRGTAD